MNTTITSALSGRLSPESPSPRARVRGKAPKQKQADPHRAIRLSLKRLRRTTIDISAQRHLAHQLDHAGKVAERKIIPKRIVIVARPEPAAQAPAPIGAD